MIINALARYYDLLVADPESGLAQPGYTTAGITFSVVLSPAGELLDILPLLMPEQRGKKTVEVPRRMQVPEQVKRTVGIDPNFMCDNSAYVFGISGKDKDKPDFGPKRFEAFRERHQALLGGVASKAAQAVLAFLAQHQPSQARENPVIAKNLDALLKGGNLVFVVDGEFAHDDPAIQRAWETHKAGQDAVIAQCLVTGGIGPIARLHPSLKGIRDANPTGASLVGFNAQAYESYNREQGLNSPVSERAAFAYTTALNHLLSSANPNKKLSLGDTTIAYWAESTDPGYANTFASLFDPDTVEEAAPETTGRKKAEAHLGQIATKLRRVQALDEAKLKQGFGDKTVFHVLGLAPNAGRVSVRFYMREPFSTIVDRMMRHYRDLELVKQFDNQPTYISVTHILGETVSSKASDRQASPLMAGAVFRAILTDAPYPAALYNAMINRIRAETDDGRRVQKVSYVRAAVIKAFLIRKYRHQPKSALQEVLTVSLNEQATQPAYVLGRLFSVLEKVQQEAIGNVNASIKDRYFTSACASPARVFPVLLRLSTHHISKAEYGYTSDRAIQTILGLLDVDRNPYPARLSLDEQGIFVLGYYHQRAALYTKKTDVSETVPDAGPTE